MSPQVTSLTTGRGYTEGPALLDDGRIAFTSMSEGRVLILGGTDVHAEIETGGGPTGLLVGHDGGLFVAQNNGQWGAPSNGRAVLMKWDGSQLSPALDAPLTAPNDLCFGPDGQMYITDPLTEQALDSPVEGRVFRWDPSSGETSIVADDILFPNGIAFDQEGKLFVAETYTGRILELDPVTGSTNVFAQTADGKPDGMAFDIEGNLWIAVNASDSVQVFASTGQLIERLPLGDGSYPSNLCFAGSRLIVTTPGFGGAVSCEVGVAGLPLHQGLALSDTTKESTDG